MDIRELTQQEAKAYPVCRGPQLSQLMEERAWFYAPSARVLGIINFDKVDHDWNFVTLTQWETQRGYSLREAKSKGLRPGEYVAIDMQVSLPSFEVARTKLFTAMSRVGV
jgi:hypothetical protein